MKRAFLLLIFLGLAAHAKAAPFYFAQNSAGANNGTNCANAYNAARFNTLDSNWTAGNILHICGTWTGTAGSTLLTTQAAGSAGNPIIILFEPGAVLQAPYFGTFCNSNGCGAGAINVNKQFIIVDGGSNGDIHNTANGTGLANTHSSLGVFVAASNVIVRNLNIHDIYTNLGSGSGATDAAGVNTANIRVDNGATNVTLCKNTLKNARTGIWSDSSGTAAGTSQACSNNAVATGVNYFGNILDDHCWMISANGSGAVNIFGNDFGTYVSWAYPIAAYHTDGIIVFGDVGSVITANIYNSYFHGDLGLGSPTGFIFCTYGDVGSGSKCNIFNNVMVGLGSMAASNDALIYFHSADGHPLGPHFIANNTFVNGGYGFDMDGDSTTHYTILNNIWQGVSGGSTWAFHQESSSQTWATLDNINGNNYFQLKTSAWNWNSTIFASLAAWKTGCSGAGVTGCDSSSSSGNPNLTVTYTLGLSSPAIGLGVNLTSIATGNLAPLLNDKAGVARPGGSTAWDAGALSAGLSPSITTASPLPNGFQNIAYSTTISGVGGTLPYAWSVISGSLPTGLSINSSTGVISGTPTVVAASSFTVQLTDANSLSNSRVFSLTINSTAPATFGAPTGRLP